ncbi:hemerythrin domain-containing protein [Aliiglaciecola sp. CAU 1673]|uniref:hemerythrin domain-containing protein n=1 Tax=Aliiglaciecola sp. CAU 1673 TaxID=3032595 RepID=UPI0023DA7DBC|nr:hemerythrin domain-containing protein [Aliiglaciecola sp. CAU 1673]MDF2177417.1 hemerythrin domain-containing protein [Aliiglaciecola sp. CAU 1673]
MQSFVTQFFTSDLQGLELLFIAYRKSKRQDLLLSITYFEKFKAGIERHFAQVEQLLFPLLYQDGPDRDSVSKARREHQQIRQQLSWIATLLERGVDSSEDDQALEFMLSDHLENDEFTLYPLCDKRLSEDAMGPLLLGLY